jgi:peptidase E
MKKILYIFIFLFLAVAGSASAHQVRVVYLQQGNVQISNPEVSQAFYDELKGKPRDYFITSPQGFDLNINLLVPEIANRDGRYSATIFSENGGEQQIAELDGGSADWNEYYEPMGRDYYLQGPSLEKQLAAGKYKIEVFSKDNQGKYVLVVGQKEVYDVPSILNAYWQLPFLKVTFFKTSVLQFFLTPFGIGLVGAVGALLILFALIYYISGVVHQLIKHNQAKTLLLTSAGMQMKKEITKLLQKPAYDITVVFISTAAKSAENLDYLRMDWNIMRDEMGFNVEEYDIEGKKEDEVMKELEFKDIIYVEGGNTFYLLKAMRECNFERVIKKLLKMGKVYVGSSAGSIVAGRSIQTAEWIGDRNTVHLKDLRGLNIVPFDIFCHYRPEYAEIIKQKIKNPKKRAKRLKIITDQQAILVQGKETDLIGEGNAIIV